ncbi:MAG: hypothetical protein RJA07_892 [Bacteroidota bacterium]|jgi:hypothetical protein
MKIENKKQWWLLFASIALIVVAVSFMFIKIGGLKSWRSIYDLIFASFVFGGLFLLPSLFLSSFIKLFKQDKISYWWSVTVCNFVSVILILLFVFFRVLFPAFFTTKEVVNNHSFYNSGYGYTEEQIPVCKKVVDTLEALFAKDSMVILSSSIKTFKDSSTLACCPNLRFQVFSTFRINNKNHLPIRYFNLMEINDQNETTNFLTNEISSKYFPLIDSLQFSGHYYFLEEDTVVINSIERFNNSLEKK